MKTKNHLCHKPLRGASVCCSILLALMTSTPGYSSTLDKASARELSHQTLTSVLWVQHAAEYRALCLQAFNLATLRLDAFLSTYHGAKPVAVIVDIDETILSSARYHAYIIKHGKLHSHKTWTPYVAQALGTATPGSVQFLNYAKSRGVSIFYITNRKHEEYTGTVNNLNKAGFPDANPAHILMKQHSHDKQLRRDQVKQNFSVALLLGDDLNDFMSVFRYQSAANRLAWTNQVKNLWGKKFILLPNPMYGDWDNTIYKWQDPLTAKEKLDIRNKQLDTGGFQP